MLDINLLRKTPEALDAGLARRNMAPLSAELQQLDSATRRARTTWENLQAERNTLSKQIGEVKKSGGDAADLMARVAAIKIEMESAEAAEKEAMAALEERMSAIPNIPAADVPPGRDEHDNVERFRHLEAPRINNARDHVDLGTGLGLMDFDAAAKLSGSRFVVLRGALARLERALGQFMINTHTTEHGYTEVNTPLLVGTAAMYGTAQLPKFRDDQFKIQDYDLWLIPTSEVSLTNLAADQIIDETELPWRLTGLTPCFRGEAGSAGRDTRGMIRQHQFWKCELVSVTTPEQSAEEHERMVESAQNILKKLGLPFRTVTLCAGDMGFAAQKTYDIEVWLPGQNAYREISSCSNCGDFQARRMKARTRSKDSKNTRPVHTLNGSGLAVGRTLVAVLENYQNADGSIRVPDVLIPYMGGLEVITR